MHPDTLLAHYDACPGDPHQPTSTPIYQTATFEQESAEHFGSYDYSRSGNPTRTVLEERLATLEGGRFGWVQNAEGTALAPFDAWLVLRGLKTLGVRLDREQQSALELARFLETDPRIAKVHYPGLASHPGHLVQARQARGWGQLVSFETGSVERSIRVAEDTRLFSIAVSFGSTSSTIGLPHRMSHASVPADSPRQGALPADLVRISVGLEDARDLIADLDRALGRAPGSGSPGPAPFSTLAAANGSPPR